MLNDNHRGKAMVRPRAGDFVYSEEELSVMLQDISVFKEYGAQGVVFGVLTAAGDIDETRVSRSVSTPFHKMPEIEFTTGWFRRHYP